MHNALRKSLVIGFSVIGLSLLAQAAQADPLLPGLTNLNFLNFTGVAPKADFVSVNPTGWTGGTGLIFIDRPGTSATQIQQRPVVRPISDIRLSQHVGHCRRLQRGGGGREPEF